LHIWLTVLNTDILGCANYLSVPSYCVWNCCTRTAERQTDRQRERERRREKK